MGFDLPCRGVLAVGRHRSRLTTLDNMPHSANASTASIVLGVSAPAASPVSPSKVVKATLQYAKPLSAGDELFVYKYQLPEGVIQATNMEADQVEVDVTDLRTLEQPLNLLRNGFQLERFEVPHDINWEDADDIASRYYPQVIDLLKASTGGSRVHIFDHTIRKASDNSRIQEQQAQQSVEARGAPVSRVHVDYTTKSGPIRLEAALPDEAEQLMKTPFAVIQVWRPLRGPVQDSPLGMLDAATVSNHDLMSYSLHFPGRTGYNYTAKYNSAHRWYYAKDMDVNEAYVFVCYDSRGDGRARFTPHTGFKVPTTPVNALPRQSIETRAFVFWETQPEQDIAHSL